MELVKGCYVCKKIDKNMSKCSVCRITIYCGIECQKQHCPTHILICNADQKRTGQRSAKVNKMFQKNEKLMKVMAAIYFIHWRKDISLGVMLMETRFLEYEGIVNSYPIDSDTIPDDQYNFIPENMYDFVISLLDEKDPIPQQNLRTAIDIESCRKCYDELLAPKELTLPFNITIGHDQVCIYNDKLTS